MKNVHIPAEYAESGVNAARFGPKPVTGIHNVSVPTLTIYGPKDHNNGAALIVFPGGGFQQLAVDLEGTEACEWANGLGMTCIVVKYCVPNTNHHYEPACNCAVTPKVLLALQDAQRAIRMVRAQASHLHINPHRIGVIGFSAGGYLVAQTSNITTPAYSPVDSIDQISSRPDFAIALYPGHIFRGENGMDPGLKVTDKTPPTFIVQNWDDPVDDVRNSLIYARALKDNGVAAEMHIFAKGGHAFGFRPVGHPVTVWPRLAEDWMTETNLLPRQKSLRWP